MFKKSLLFIFIALSMNSVLLGQSYNYALYDIKIDQKRFSEFMSKGLNSFEKKLYKKMLNSVNRSQISVSFDEHTSVCEPVEQLSLDNSNPQLAKSALFLLIGFETTYVDKESNLLYVKTGKGDVVHLVKSKMKTPKWNITTNEKKVNNLVYKKATAKIDNGRLIYEIDAWFCPSIPTQFGPGGFFGLPGLVTEVYVKDKDYSYSFILSKIKKKKKLKLNIPIDKYKVYTEEESQELFRKLNGSNN